MRTDPASPWAALFDWDGVVVDSSRLHALSWEDLAREEGLSLPEGHFKLGFGRKNEAIIPDILGWTAEPGEVRRLSLRKEELYRRTVRETGLDLLPGVRAWLENLRDSRVPCVIGSSTVRANIEAVLDSLGIGAFFCGVITGEDVREGKPHPEVFLRAARLAGLPPGRCVVFEDATVGIEAARAGGMRVVAVTTTSPAAALSGADRIVDRLDELRIEDMADLVR